MSKASVFGSYHPQPYFGPEGAVYFNRQGAAGAATNGQWVTRWNGQEFETPTKWDVIDRLRRTRTGLQMFEGALSPDGRFVIVVAAAMDHERRRRHPA